MSLTRGRSASSGSGTPGASAYDIAVANGFVGTEAQWLASLVGSPGSPGSPGGASARSTLGIPGAGPVHDLWPFPAFRRTS